MNRDFWFNVGTILVCVGVLFVLIAREPKPTITPDQQQAAQSREEYAQKYLNAEIRYASDKFGNCYYWTHNNSPQLILCSKIGK